MINVMISDDEYWVRKSIIGKIDWVKLGAKLVGECSNGMEMIDMISKLQPDIVISDMRMPEMDGIELINYLRNKKPDIKVVIISGYSDFEYTKEALKNKVEDYILKPVDEDILNECLEKTISAIQNERIEHMEIKEIYLNKIVSDANMKKEDIIDCCLKYNLDTNYKFFSVCIFKFSNLHKDAPIEDKIIKEILDELNGILFKHLNTDYEYVCILRTNVKNSDMFITNLFKKHIWKLNSNLSINTEIFLGNFYNLETIHNSYMEAMESMNFIAVNNTPNIIHYNNIKNSKCLYITPLKVSNEIKNMLISSIKCNKLDDIERIVENMCLIFNQYEFLNINNLSIFYNDLFWCIENEFKNHIATLKNTLPYNFSDNTNNKHFTSVNEFKVEIYKSLCHISNTYICKFSNNSKTTINNIKNYIDENYEKKLSLKEIADMFHFNEIYLCKMFKNETGTTFLDYLTSLRMEKAMEYLKNSSMKISDIACAVGYEDQRYFSKIFKKSFNLLPSEARNMK